MTNANPNQTPDLSPMAQELIQNEAPDDALKALLNELEETAAELRDELAARHSTNQSLQDDEVDAASRYKKVNPNVTPEQEAELENFPEYWANAKGSWSNLFKLLREFRVEMRKGHKDA